MEEKERYIISKGENISIADNDQKVIFNITTKKLQDLLNRRDNQIKKLEEENKKLNEAFKLSCIDNLRDCGILETDYGFEEKLKEEMKYYLNEVK